MKNEKIILTEEQLDQLLFEEMTFQAKMKQNTHLIMKQIKRYRRRHMALELLYLFLYSFLIPMLIATTAFFLIQYAYLQTNAQTTILLIPLITGLCFVAHAHYQKVKINF